MIKSGKFITFSYPQKTVMHLTCTTVFNIRKYHKSPAYIPPALCIQ